MSLVIYPSPLLKEKSFPILSSIQYDNELQKFIEEMYSAMETFGGIGLSAIQLGIAKSIFVLSINGERQTVINPCILETSDEFSYENEGCLSIPQVWTRVRRPETIKVEFFNEKGEKQTKEYKGIWSRAFQHEYDHLCGLTFFDRINKYQAQTVLKKYKKNTMSFPFKSV